MKYTIKDVARKCGVSIATVSRVLNGSKPVSKELAEKVMKADNEAHYKPNSIARSLILKKTNLLGVVIPNVSQPFHGLALSGIEEIASQNGYNVIICNVFDSLEKELKYFKILEEKQVDGIILMHESTSSEVINFIEETHIPIVLASVLIEGVHLPSVKIDDFKASYDAVKYLIDSGHRNIAMICGKEITAGDYRSKGYYKALTDCGLHINPQYMKEGSFTVRSGYEIMKQFLKLKPLPTALFAANDEMAIGAINCILDHGLNVPRDISVVGFDGIEWSSIYRPRLTTIQQPIKRIGMEAAKLLVRILNSGNCDISDITLDYQLIVRESSMSR